MNYNTNMARQLQYHFCTLFDRNYLLRGLALYQSLLRHCPNFHLFIFPFDQPTLDLLTTLNLTKVTIVPLVKLEGPELLQVKPTRTPGEYCWTCTPAIIKYTIETFRLDACTYLDADLFFYADPAPLIQEMGENSVLITEHRYTPKYDLSHLSGIYCVQFITFKNDEAGSKVLNWWYQACLSWCFNRYEAGKFGDQKYLDDWPTRFDKVHVLQHRGGGIAPWNVQQVDYQRQKDQIIFYHFHQLKIFANGTVDLCLYQLRPADLAYFYRPYLQQIIQIQRQLGPHLEPLGAIPKWDLPPQKMHYWHQAWRKFKRRIKQIYHVYPLSDFVPPL